MLTANQMEHLSYHPLQQPLVSYGQIYSPGVKQPAQLILQQVQQILDVIHNQILVLVHLQPCHWLE